MICGDFDDPGFHLGRNVAMCEMVTTNVVSMKRLFR